MSVKYAEKAKTAIWSILT